MASAGRPVVSMYLRVSSSIGNMVAVAPNSGDMFEMVARSASVREDSPAP